MLNKKVALLVSAMGSFLTPFMGSSVNIALPSIGKEFQLDAILLSWVAISYLLSTAMFLLPMGKMGDIYGRKKIFLYGIWVYTFFSLICGVSNSTTALIASRVLQGLGGAMIFATCMAIVTSVFPPNERGKAIGINVAAVYIGLSIGPFAGGFLTQHFGWRSIFLINVPLGIITALTVMLKLTGEWAEAKGEKFDLTGSIVYGISLAALMYGFSHLPSAAGFMLCVSGLTGLVSFVAWEMKTRNPVLNTGLFKNNAVFTLSNIAALINYCATASVGFFLSLYLQYIKGLSPASAGMILVSQPVIMAVFSPITGKLSDKIEPRILASAGMALTAIGLALLVFLNGRSNTVFIVCILILIGAGFALFSSPNTNAVMSSVEKKFYGVASATLGTMRLIGHMMSLGISMLIFAVYLGKNKIAPENYPLFLMSMKTAFIIFSALCFAGIFASHARGKVR